MKGMRQDWETDVREVRERVIQGFSGWVQTVKLFLFRLNSYYRYPPQRRLLIRQRYGGALAR